MSNQPNPLTRFLLWLSGAPAPGAQPGLERSGGSSGQAQQPASGKAATEEPASLPGEDRVDTAQVEILADEPSPAAAEPVDAAEPSDAEAGPINGEAAAPEPLEALAPEAGPAPVDGDPANDAAAYGVEVTQADVPEGADYWQAVRVHHLTPEENHGNHHLFLEALDETGQRVQGAQAHVTWEGGEQVVTVDKPAGEPGTNCPMWKWQICSVAMLGLPSDTVSKLHTGHPDEPPGTGNTLFHHSFQVDFQRTVKSSGQPAASSVISGVAPSLAGEKLLLTLDGEIVGSQVVAPTGDFSFANLAAGVYLLVVESTGVRSDPIGVDGTNAVTASLPVAPAEPPAGKFIERYVLFGPSSSARTGVYLSLADEYLMSRRPAFGFRPEDAFYSQQVILVGGPEDIPAAAEEALVQGGSRVQRIQGTPEEIAAAFRALQG